jgi:hypothetical protein
MATSATLSLTPFIVAAHLIDQFNRYRQVEILSHIRHCDGKMKLNEICESYSFDNHTYTLNRDYYAEFQSLQHIYDALVSRVIVKKLIKFCSTSQWCLENLSIEDINFTIDILKQRGNAFCSLQKCHHRLVTQINACPTTSNRVGSSCMYYVHHHHITECEPANCQTISSVMCSLPRASAIDVNDMHQSSCVSSSSCSRILVRIRGNLLMLMFSLNHSLF